MNKIGLTLSGGGVRASVFHAGVLLFLAEKEQLEKISHLSTVSGGTLLTGLIYHLSGMEFPSSAQYENDVYPLIRKQLTSMCLQSKLYMKTLNPLNWKYFFTRAKVLEEAIYKDWGITSLCSDVSKTPIWSLNGTTAETGRRFRIKNATMGDYELGYAETKSILLASAMSISAAFPFGIGPLPIETASYSWYKKETWDAENARLIQPDYKKIHIYDAGLYDNLGTEPLFDNGRQELKESAQINSLIVSDASAYFQRMSIPFVLSFSRGKRVIDITIEQARSLRIRSLAHYFNQNANKGMLITIGDQIQKTTAPQILEKINKETWLSTEKKTKASLFPTTLKKMTLDDFDIIARHGYECARLQWIINEYK